tara:strand:+ start:721 stop:1017 length:297 start_codon:yes stop_codon:yes gene_type:complete
MTLEEIRNEIIRCYHISDYRQARVFWDTASLIIEDIDPASLDSDDSVLLTKLKELGVLANDDAVWENYGGLAEKVEEIIYDMRDRGIPAGGKDGNQIG